MWNILLVDDEPKNHANVRMALPPDFHLMSCYNGNEAIAALTEEKPDLILCEMDLPDMNGLTILKCDTFKMGQPVFIATSNSGDTHLIVDAIKAGADEYIIKPYTQGQLLETIRKYLVLKEPVQHLRNTDEAAGNRPLVGDSPAMRAINRQIHAFAGSDSTILITGESGTGKEIVAQELHFFSPRTGGPFYPVNCGALPETLFESEMFGSERGAFTDAVARTGWFEGSDKGTLFLDEIGELSPLTQVKLLRILEDKRINRLGSYKPILVDVRIIAATNRDLRESVITGRFRSDLFYRLNVLHIHIPPLRERLEDIPALSYTFLREFQKKGDETKYFSNYAITKLESYSWPGNVRELKNVIQRGFFLCAGNKIQPNDIQFE
jgi:two-component system NtrC family response regulator